MKIKTSIEVQRYGDTHLYTDCIMVHSEKLIVDDILKEFYEIQGINSMSGLDYEMLNTITDNFIAFLELKGFNRLYPNIIYFCD